MKIKVWVYTVVAFEEGVVAQHLSMNVNMDNAQLAFPLDKTISVF